MIVVVLADAALLAVDRALDSAHPVLAATKPPFHRPPPWWITSRAPCRSGFSHLSADLRGPPAGLRRRTYDWRSKTTSPTTSTPSESTPVLGPLRPACTHVSAGRLRSGTMPALTIIQHGEDASSQRAWPQLRAGELLETKSGVIRVTGVGTESLAPAEVFNLEVVGAHRYFVGKHRVLAHNAYGDAAAKAIFYGETGVEAKITPDMIGTGTRASGSIRPPGWVDDAGFARGHLLGRQLGGSGGEANNLVTLFQNPANHPVMSGFEAQIRAAVEGGQVVNFGAMPIYRAGSAIPAGVTIVGEGSGGFSLAVTVLNGG